MNSRAPSDNRPATFLNGSSFIRTNEENRLNRTSLGLSYNKQIQYLFIKNVPTSLAIHVTIINRTKHVIQILELIVTKDTFARNANFANFHNLHR